MQAAQHRQIFFKTAEKIVTRLVLTCSWLESMMMFLFQVSQATVPRFLLKNQLRSLKCEDLGKTVE